MAEGLVLDDLRGARIESVQIYEASVTFHLSHEGQALSLSTLADINVGELAPQEHFLTDGAAITLREIIGTTISAIERLTNGICMILDQGSRIEVIRQPGDDYSISYCVKDEAGRSPVSFD